MKRQHFYRSMEIVVSAMTMHRTEKAIRKNALQRYDGLYGFPFMQGLLPLKEFEKALDMALNAITGKD